MRAHRLFSAIGLSGALAGCAVIHHTHCPAGLDRMTSAELVFGKSISGGGVISDTEWTQFVDTEVTPRFPDGFSVLDARGQWRDPGGALVREPSKLLLLVIKGTKEEQAKLSAIREAYKARFKQQSVLLIEHRGCAAF